MRIVIDLTQLADRLSGLERYAMNIARELILADHGENTYILFYKNKECKELSDINHKSNVQVKVYRGSNKLLFNQLQLPWYLYREKKVDKYLFLAFPCPLLFHKKGIYTLIADLTCWDCPQTMKGKARFYFRETLKHSVRVSERLVTISEFSRQRILDRFGGRKMEDKIILAYCAVSDIFVNAEPKDPAAQKRIKEKYGLPERYFLCLSTLEPRKNLPLLIEAYRELLSEMPAGDQKTDAKLPGLVLAGRKGWMVETFLKDIQEQYPQQVVLTGFVEDEDLPEIYRMAECFVFPSLYEGFGMPPLEALAVGTPVISSDAASMPEVLGGHAIYFASGNCEQLKERMKEICTCPPRRQKYIDGRFDWKISAQKIREAIYE